MKVNSIVSVLSVIMHLEFDLEIDMKKVKSGVSPIDAALKFLTPKARTIREIEDYLDDCQYSEYDVYATVERLKELGYADDLRYAHDFIDSRLATKPVSKQKLREQLISHSVSRDIINEALANITPETEYANALATAKKYFHQLSDLPHDERVRRTVKRLVSHGYDYSDAKLCMEELCDERIDDELE